MYLTQVHLSKYVKAKEDKEKGKPKIYSTAAVLRDGKVSRYKIDLGKHHISDIQVTFALDNSLILAGFYSSRSEFYVNGIFMVGEDADAQELDEIRFHEITRFQSERSEKKASKKEDKGKEIQFNNYDIRNIEVTPTGVYIIAEQFYVTQSSTQGYGMPDTPGATKAKTTYTFNFLDVMVAKLHFYGDLNWISRVPRHNFAKTSTSGPTYSFSSGFMGFGGNGMVSPYVLQYWNRTGYIEKINPFSSYTYTLKNDEIYILYNDHIKNHTQYNPRKISKSKKGGDKAVTCLAKIDNEGEMTRKYFYNVKEEATFTQVRSCVPLDSEAGFIILGQKRKTIKLGKFVAE